MMRMLALLAVLFAAAPAVAQQGLPAGADPQNTLVIDTTQGRIYVKLRNDIAPKHAERLKQLARDKFYDNVPFHRVIAGFMAQTGDGQHGNGTGGSKYPDLPAEFSNVPYKRGVVGMARTSDPEFGEQPVLHHVRRRAVPQRQVHRSRRSVVGHGRRRQAQEGRRAERQRDRAGQDDERARRRGREVTADCRHR